MLTSQRTSRYTDPVFTCLNLTKLKWFGLKMLVSDGIAYGENKSFQEVWRGSAGKRWTSEEQMEESLPT